MAWLKNAWQVAAFSSELTDGMVARQLCDELVLLYRTQDGRVVAMQDQCPHRLLPLSLGQRIGDEIQCGYHGMCFGADGACTHVPGQTEIPASARVPIYPTTERYGLVWIWLGAPALADAGLIPDLHWMDYPGWVVTTGYLFIKANYRLVTDNLLDLSHETYIHAKTIGNGHEEAIADYPVQVSQEGGRLVRAHREMPEITPPPFFAAIQQGNATIDRWQSAVYMPPGVHMTDVGIYAVGTPREDAFMHRVFHLLTPETDTSTHYFWAFCRKYRHEDEGLSNFIRAGNDSTFDEDRVILERQQEILLRNPHETVPKVGIRLDVAPVQARRMLAQLIEREQADPRAVAPPVSLAEEGPPTMPAARAMA